MNLVISKSSFLSSEIAGIAGTEDFLFHAADGNPEINAWLNEYLREHRVSAVFYESGFSVDPAPFRKASPNTRFVFIADTGEEHLSRTALDCGASAVLNKPLDPGEVFGVLSSVSR